jgi:MFS family permease
VRDVTSRAGKHPGPAPVVRRVSAAAPAVRTPSRAWVVWAVGLLAYAIAVFHRASLGVSGVAAQERFDTGASALSLFVVLQLTVYAALQVPVGAALDRLGSRRVLLAGALTMALGQLGLALAGDVTTAVAARVLVGAGDAMTFISVLRVVSLWFPGRVVPVVTQLTGILGQVGQIAAAYPLVRVLDAAGWAPTFAGAAAISVLVALLVAVALRDAPPGTDLGSPLAMAQVRRNLSEAWREPGTQLGLYTHLVTQFSGTVFGLLWGFPFLVLGQGLAPGTAAALLSVLVVVGMAVGPVLGQLCGRWPLRRSVLVFTVVGATVGVWTAVLLWPGPAPLPLLVLLVLVLGTNGPGAMIGFDYARTTNPAPRLGSATGVVNVGGFVASLLTMLVMGLLLDLQTPGGAADYSLGAFKTAFAVQYLFWALGLLGVLRHRRRLRQRLAAEGVVPAPLHVAVRARARGSSAYR